MFEIQELHVGISLTILERQYAPILDIPLRSYDLVKCTITITYDSKHVAQCWVTSRCYDLIASVPLQTDQLTVTSNHQVFKWSAE